MTKEEYEALCKPLNKKKVELRAIITKLTNEGRNKELGKYSDELGKVRKTLKKLTNIRYDQKTKKLTKKQIKDKAISNVNSIIDNFNASAVIKGVTDNSFDIGKMFGFKRILMNPQDLKSRFKNKQKNAKERGLEFDLSFETFEILMNQRYCAYSGYEFEDADDMSLDRIDNNKGYVEGNVINCHVSINSAKSDLTDQEIESMYIRMINGRVQIINTPISKEYLILLYNNVGKFINRKPLEEFTI